MQPVALIPPTTCRLSESSSTNRSYRRALSVDAALDELDACAGTQFDPDVVAALTHVIRSGPVRVDRRRALTPKANAKTGDAV